MPKTVLTVLSQAAALLSPAHLTVWGAMLWGILLYLVCLALFFRRKGLFENLCLAVLFVYLAALLQMAQCLAVPSSLSWDKPAAALALGSVEWDPLRSGGQGLGSFLNGWGHSFLAFVPLGFLVPMANPRFRLGRMVVLSLLCGTGLEALELLSNILTRNVARSVRTEDAILGAAGCLAAYLLFAGLKKFAVPKHRARHYARSH